MKLIQVKSDEEVLMARALFEEYAAWLGINLCFQNFDKELAELPGDYVPPDGCLFLATQNNQIAGCVALRKIDARKTGDGIAEMKRLYVRPQFRGKGVGRRLTEAVIEAARDRLPPHSARYFTRQDGSSDCHVPFAGLQEYRTVLQKPSARCCLHGIAPGSRAG